MKIRLIVGLLVVTLSMGLGVCFGAMDDYSPVANLTERWTNDALWTVSRDGAPAVVDETMSLSFAAQSVPIPMVGALKSDSHASSGRFVGNYVASAVTHASFDIMRTGLAASARLQFVGKSGKLWYCTFALPDQQGVWEARKISMTYSDAWKASGITGAVAFDDDRTDVKSLEVRVVSDGNGAQQVRIDNFKVVGPWEKGPLTVDEMPQYWLLENGLPVQDGQAGLDKDNDGFNNFSEYLAGTDPSDPNSQFRIEIERDADGNPVLSWKRADYRSYKVFKSTNLVASDAFVEEIGSIQAVGLKNKMTIASEAGGISFYRVQVDKQ